MSVFVAVMLFTPTVSNFEGSDEKVNEKSFVLGVNRVESYPPNIKLPNIDFSLYIAPAV